MESPADASSKAELANLRAQRDGLVKANAEYESQHDAGRFTATIAEHKERIRLIDERIAELIPKPAAKQ